jgi:hypothetical protein
MIFTNRLMKLSNRAVLGVLMGVALLTSAGSLVVNLLMNQGTNPVWWEGWLRNFSAEIFGAFLTFLLIEVLAGGRRARDAEQREAEEQKQRLIRQMGSKDKGVALQAVEELRGQNWLTDGSLHGAFLHGANLEGVDLRVADMQGVVLAVANPQEALLSGANLQGADLGQANLQGAVLTLASLQGGDLGGANLQGAYLRGANLQKASLRMANLQGANLAGPLCQHE